MSVEEERQAIDRLDEQILALLNQRAALAKKICEIRQHSFDPAREKHVLDRLLSLNAGPLPAGAVRAIYSLIIAEMRLLARGITACYLGPQGTYAHAAAIKKFGPHADLMPTDSIPDIFDQVEAGKAQFGVVPFENSIEGVVSIALDRFMESNLQACSEINLDIVHHLLSRSPLERITRVYSMGQPLAQCHRWLRQNLPAAERIEVASTARAAQLAGAEPTSAAIASELAADIHGVPIVCRSIQDSPFNRTRFLVLSPVSSPAGASDKTSLLFAVKHEPGALHKALAAFSDHHVNLTLIQSRPTKKIPWEYVFFVDCQGHASAPPLIQALKALQDRCLFVKVLGSYPEGD